ncbi:MAG TPA: NAD(P)H-dependent oxidoreductase [Gammaproteobacteria bacterium]|nr:NAD(P)H-dependent oxidoreductase [Gammaproteobacteria bacterium]
MNPSIHIVAISGSLRAASSNTALLRAASSLAPADLEIELFEDIDALPPFNPDREDELYEDAGAGRYHTGLAPDLAVVRELNERVRDAHGLLIACPEYARGVPGVFKNALDWLVGSNAFVAKPFALFNASPRASHAQDAVRLTLETMSGQLVEEACIVVPLLNRNLDARAIMADDTLAAPVRKALAAFTAAIKRHHQDCVNAAC